MAKSADAFRTISEVAEWLEVPAHVLRFWESKFTQVKPVKRGGGRRYYRPADMRLLGGIKTLLHDEGMTIKGVQKILREEGVKHVVGLSPPLDAADEHVLDMAAPTPIRAGQVISFERSGESPNDERSVPEGKTADAIDDAPQADSIPARETEARPSPPAPDTERSMPVTEADAEPPQEPEADDATSGAEPGPKPDLTPNGDPSPLPEETPPPDTAPPTSMIEGNAGASPEPDVATVVPETGPEVTAEAGAVSEPELIPDAESAALPVDRSPENIFADDTVDLRQESLEEAPEPSETTTPSLPPLPDLPEDPTDIQPCTPGPLHSLVTLERPVSDELAAELAGLLDRLRACGGRKDANDVPGI